MPERGYYATPAEQEQRKMEALQSIAESLLEIKQLLANSTNRTGTLVVETRPEQYY